MGNVWKYAEFGGSKLVVLLAVADVANDAHDNEFWMGSGKLADKCRMDARNVRRRLKELVDEGWLIQLELGGGMGKPSRYRFVPRTDTGSYNPEGETGSFDPVTGSDNPLNRVIEPGLPGHTARHIYNSIETQSELKELNCENEFFPVAIETEIEVVSDKQIVKEMFDEFWNAYNHKKDKQGAITQWNKHIKDRAMAEMVIEKARQYNAATDPGYMKLPSGWLRGKRWEDELVGNRKMSAAEKSRAGLRQIALERGLLDD